MNNPEKIPVFADLSKALEHISGLIFPSEAHGLLCGFICASYGSGSKQWIESVTDSAMNDFDTMQKNRILLQRVYETSRSQLQNASHDFKLLLPENSSSLLDQAYALSCWCQGFLSAFDFAGIKKDALPDEVQEMLVHFDEISELNYHEIEVEKNDEKALREAMDYVRNSTIKIYRMISQSNYSLH